MKSTTFVAILLTFLMLLLVLAGAITFVWQDRQQAVAATTRLHTEKTELQGTATIVRSYLAAREEGLATAQARGTAAAINLAQAAATNLALEGTREGLLAERAVLATRTASLEAVLLQPPSVAIIAPRPDSIMAQEGSDEQVVVAASHPQGISALQLSLGEAQEQFAAAGEPFRVFTYTLPSPLAPGLYTVTATITATNSLTATATTTFRVPPGEESGDSEGFVVPRRSSRYPVFFKPAAIPLIVRKIARRSD